MRSTPGSGTQLRCSFPFALPRFAPTAVPRVLTFRSHFRSFPFRFRILSSASAFLPATQPSALPFCSPAVPPHACFPARRLRSRFRGLPVLSSPISRAFLPGSLTQLRCPFPFVLPCFAPAAVPQVIPFRISSPGPVPDFRFLSSASVLAPHYSASVSSFPTLPVLASQWLLR